MGIIYWGAKHRKIGESGYKDNEFCFKTHARPPKGEGLNISKFSLQLEIITLLFFFKVEDALTFCIE